MIRQLVVTFVAAVLAVTGASNPRAAIAPDRGTKVPHYVPTLEHPDRGTEVPHYVPTLEHPDRGTEVPRDVPALEHPDRGSEVPRDVPSLEHVARDFSPATTFFAPATARATQSPADAIFGGGCFWCVEEALEKVPGVESVVSGYSGGTLKNPSYEQVSNGGTGHVEVVRVTFDPAKISYAALLDVFWRNIDPTDPGGQFCDRGDQYRPVIFVRDEEQRAAAEKSKQALQASGRFKQGIATRIETAAPFYAAETYHQDYYKKNPVQYRFYKFSCGRAARLEEIWGGK